MTESQLFQHAMDRARENVGELENPEADILPVFLWLGPHGLGIMPMLGMSSDKAKDGIAAGMMAAMVVSRATEAAMITTSWMVLAGKRGDGPAKWDGVMPSEHPDRQEAVCVMHVDGGGCTMGSALLTRYPDKPPDLAQWQVMDREGMAAGGRFGDAMSHGIAMVKDSPPDMVEIIESAWAAGEEEDLMRRFLKVYGAMSGVKAGVTALSSDALDKEITPRQMSDRYRIPLRTIYEVCKSGVLAARRENGKWLINEINAAEYAWGYSLRREERERNDRTNGE